MGGRRAGLGKLTEAAEASRKASDIMHKLVADNPATTTFQLDLANSQTVVGRVLDRQKRFAEALSACDEGLVIIQKLAKADPNDNYYSQVLGESHGVRGRVRARAGQPAEAANDLRRALETWAKVPEMDVDSQAERSRGLAMLARLGDDAKSGVTKDEAKAFADQSVAALTNAVKLGWAYPGELKEPEFDAVRGRDDFRKLLAEVEAKSGPKPKPED